MFTQPQAALGSCLRFLRTGFITTLAIIGSLGFQSVQATDLLIIEKIKCIKPAGGLDNAGVAGLTALTAVTVAATAFTGVGIVTGATLAASASAGTVAGGLAFEAKDFLDGEFSGQDDLIVQVNGKKVFPLDRTFFPINAGEEVDVDLKVSFEQGARIQLIEHDVGSDNDNIGSIDVRSDTFDLDLAKRGNDYTVSGQIVFAPEDEDGSIYEITYSVKRNAGIAANVTPALMCGTNQCTECVTGNCDFQDYSELDRDGDIEDLLNCPFPYAASGYRKFPQAFFLDDVYLKKCYMQICTVDTPSSLSFQIEGERSHFNWNLTPGAQQYEIAIVDDASGLLVYRKIVSSTTHTLRTTFFGSSFTPGDYRFQVRGISLFKEGCKSAWSSPMAFTLPPLNVNLVTTTQSVITTLSANKSRLGSGSIDVSPRPFSQISGNLYSRDLIVTMTAKPSLQSEFDSWTGAAESCGSTSSSCEITMTSDLNAIAVFKPKPILKVLRSGNGIGTIETDVQGDGCSAESTRCTTYSTGTPVTLTATASQFSAFVRWEGDCVANSSGSTASVIMDQDKNCEATFARTDYQLTVSGGANAAVTGDILNEINCGSDCEEVYSVSNGLKTVKLTAKVDPDFVFVRWHGSTDCFDEDEGDGNPETASITVGGADVSCKAVSVLSGSEFALTVNKTGGAFGTVTAESNTTVDSSAINCAFAACAQRYVVNSVIKLTATPARGTVFNGWSGDPDCADGEVNMTSNLNCTANFTSKVLLIDGSNDDTLRNEYTSTFNSIQTIVFGEEQQTDYDEWSVFFPNSTSNPDGRTVPLASDLASYSSVIWYSGNASSLASSSPLAGPSVEAEVELAQYLDGGGCLLLSSPQYHLDRGVSSFAQKYLGIKSMVDDVDQTEITGAGALELGFRNLGGRLNPTDAGLSQGLSDAIVPDPLVTGSTTLMTYADGSAAAVATDNDIYRTAYFGFPFLALNSGNTRINTMSAFLNYCQGTALNDVLEDNNSFDSAIEQHGSVAISELRILRSDEDYYRWISDGYADAKINISFIKERGDLVLEVYDNNQTLIGSGQGEEGSKEIIITNVDIGQTYFIRIFGDAKNTTNRYTLNVSFVGILDFDHDGVKDSDDVFPKDPTEQFDFDNDFIGDNIDTDNDNDGISDEFETLFGFNARSATDASEDSDKDGFTNLREALSDTNPKDSKSVPFVLPIEVDEAAAKAVAEAQAAVDAKAVADTKALAQAEEDTTSETESSGGSMSGLALFFFLLPMFMARRLSKKY